MDLGAGDAAVITGAASGIGLATARALGRRGIKVVMADVNEARLKEAAESCRAEGFEVTAVQTDVSDFDSMLNLADSAFSAYDTIRLVHLNAGISSGASLANDDTASWRTSINVNLLGVVWGIKAFLPRLKEAGGEAMILATSSGAGSEGTCFIGPGYAASKIAVMSVMESLFGLLRAEQSPIRTGIVFPPLTATHINGEPENIGFIEQFLNSQGVPGKAVQPEPVAEMILDGIERNRFFIRMNEREDELFYGSSQPPESHEWSARMIRGRAEAVLADGTPDAYVY